MWHVSKVILLVRIYIPGSVGQAPKSLIFTVPSKGSLHTRKTVKNMLENRPDDALGSLE